MRVTMLIGLPGAGKSEYIKKLVKKPFNNSIVLSSDEIREEKYGNAAIQGDTQEIFTILKERAVNAIQIGKDIIIDATNIKRKDRISILNYLDKEISGFYEFNFVKYVIIATPYYQCLTNNQKRNRQVPEEVIKRMYKSFEFPTESEIVYFCDESIEIVYPFGIENEMYAIEHPYRRYMNFSQETEFHKYTLGQHMKQTLNIMQSYSADKVLLKAAEIHDIGKPFCKEKFQDETIHYYSHANVGAYEAMFYGKAAGFSDVEIMKLCNLIEFHMRIKDEKQRKSILNVLDSKTFYQVLALSLADREAH